ncbi:MAG: Glyoxalase/bleomycin resistance protein/dioxygenase [Nevskia sp.]|nr:Glyoxalase/bleomycin resistance protein/dioxygenase [Nevskia sp.]
MTMKFNPDAPTHFERLERPTSIAKAVAISRLMFERRDVAEMTRFLKDFGLVLVDAPRPTRYFRGYGTAAWLVSVTPADQDRFVGFAVSVGAAADLSVLSKEAGVAIESAGGPGGGQRVRLTDPDGLIVDVLHGEDSVAHLPTRLSQIPANTPANRGRINQGVRTPIEPAPVFRIGHVVLQRPDFARSSTWYMRHLGLIPSDVQLLEDGKPAMGFFRLDRGADPTDHHSVAILGGPAVSLLHVSFETFDLESIGQGHQFLRAQGWTPYWGIGRHNLGSQIFDYWKDPVGDEWEHYADGDLMDASNPTGYHALTRGTLWAWGQDLPASMRPPLKLEEVPHIHAAGGFGKMDLQAVSGLMKALLAKPRPWME